jgi:sugar phosphate isomerase/epimerase
VNQPILRHIAARWSLVHYPTRENEWPLEEKFAAVKAAGFEGIIHPPREGLRELAGRHGLKLLGFFSSGKIIEFPELLQANKTCGAHHINVQLADEDTPTAEAIGLALSLIEEGKRHSVEPAIEVHRDTCTETPEKAYALADAFQKITGKLMPITWDFSHFAVVKHLTPANFIEKLIIRPDLVQHAQQFHFRPFNGHHCQIPVTDGAGNLTLELKEWLRFAEAVLKCWLEGNRDANREIFVCPEMGPVTSGYNLSTLPNSWEDAKVLRVEIDRIWNSLTGKIQ